MKGRSEQVQAANRIRCIRTKNWKYARYFHQNSAYLEEYELYFLTGKGYDLEEGPKGLNRMEKKLWKYLQKFPLEYVNLAYLANPLVKALPADVKKYITRKKKSMAKLLEKKEKELLTLDNAKIRGVAKVIEKFATRLEP